MPFLYPFFYILLTAGDFLSHIFNKTLSYAMINTSAFVEKDGRTVYKFTVQRERDIMSVFKESVKRCSKERPFWYKREDDSRQI